MTELHDPRNCHPATQAQPQQESAWKLIQDEQHLIPRKIVRDYRRKFYSYLLDPRWLKLDPNPDPIQPAQAAGQEGLQFLLEELDDILQEVELAESDEEDAEMEVAQDQPPQGAAGPGGEAMGAKRKSLTPPKVSTHRQNTTYLQMNHRKNSTPYIHMTHITLLVPSHRNADPREAAGPTAEPTTCRAHPPPPSSMHSPAQGKTWKLTWQAKAQRGWKPMESSWPRWAHRQPTKPPYWEEERWGISSSAWLTRQWSSSTSWWKTGPTVQGWRWQPTRPGRHGRPLRSPCRRTVHQPSFSIHTDPCEEHLDSNRAGRVNHCCKSADPKTIPKPNCNNTSLPSHCNLWTPNLHSLPNMYVKLVHMLSWPYTQDKQTLKTPKDGQQLDKGWSFRTELGKQGREHDTTHHYPRHWLLYCDLCYRSRECTRTSPKPQDYSRTHSHTWPQIATANPWLSLLLLRAGDVEANPGPPYTTQQAELTLQKLARGITTISQMQGTHICRLEAFRTLQQEARSILATLPTTTGHQLPQLWQGYPRDRSYQQWQDKYVGHLYQIIPRHKHNALAISRPSSRCWPMMERF